MLFGSSGTLWGVLSIIMIGRLPAELEGLYVGLLLGATAVGTVAAAGHKKLAVFFVLIVVIPFSIKTAIEGKAFWEVYLALQLMYAFIMVGVIDSFNLKMKKNFTLAEEKEQLIQQLREKYDLEKQLKEEKLRSLRNSKYVAVGEMAAGVGHEINNPLTIVLGSLWKMEKLVENGAQPSELLTLVKNSSTASKRIADVVSAMREFSNVKSKSKMEQVNLSSIVSTCKPLVERTFSESSVRLKYSFEDAIVLGNVTEFSQVLFNLLTNAFDASEDSQEKLVTIQSKEDDENVYLSVSNTGEPIPSELTEKIYQPFFSTKGVGKGSGLGLSLAKTIVENNQGEIFHKRVDDQTIFTMKLQKPQKGLDS